MKKITYLIVLLSLLLPMAVWAQCNACGKHDTAGKNVVKSDRKMLVGYDKPNWINDNFYFTYSFDKKPKLGTAILKVKVYDKNKKISKAFDVYAVSDMPSMRGAHATGDKKLKANKKGELMVPIDFVMRGVWEVELKFKQDGKVVYCGCFELTV